MKPINPRSGHGPAFGAEILYMLVAMILGWPVTMPLMFVIEKFGFEPPTSVWYGSAVVGMYVHYKIWSLIIGALREYWNK